MKCVQCQTDCYDSTSALCPECWLKARPSSHTLDPIVSTIAKHFGFAVRRDEVLDKWIISHDEMNCAFYWSSKESPCDFLDQVRAYFEEVGYEKTVR